MVRTYGEKLPGKQPSESAEMKTFFNRVRKDYPEIGNVAIHVRNEGNRSHSETNNQKAEGMVTGAADIVIPGCPAFVCEMKAKSKSSRVSKEQKTYLESADKIGAFVCIAYGWEAAIEALEDWINAR